MGKLLLLEPVGGIAGDMFLAAALDLGVPREGLDAALASLRLPGFRLLVTRAQAGGVAGTHLRVLLEPGPGGARGLSAILAIV
ncbi:MAG: nickel insertion protein, partial [Anaeromyxobacteraceae bacterium]